MKLFPGKGKDRHLTEGISDVFYLAPRSVVWVHSFIFAKPFAILAWKVFEKPNPLSISSCYPSAV